MLGGSTGFHADQASRNLVKEVDDLLATQLKGDNDLARTIHAVHLEHILGEINADGTNLHVDDPSGDSLFNDHPLAHSMSGAGVVHHIIRVVMGTVLAQSGRSPKKRGQPHFALAQTVQPYW